MINCPSFIKFRKDLVILMPPLPLALELSTAFPVKWITKSDRAAPGFFLRKKNLDARQGFKKYNFGLFYLTNLVIINTEDVHNWCRCGIAIVPRLHSVRSNWDSRPKTKLVFWHFRRRKNMFWAKFCRKNMILGRVLAFWLQIRISMTTQKISLWNFSSTSSASLF